ncbi:hypothetical protein SipoB123_22240 [Streptomyces ipomoeae]|nr:S8 family serine peptidase [Streptomyces ipomoeae]MDX2932742.1 S8 family serine peptidase [Streptomyces ipomoeae]TQE22890.1 hypothetical protein SipoB123_22240 [Streptomyces ipomoeae]
MTYGMAALLAVAGLTATTALAVATQTGAAPEGATGVGAATAHVTLITGDIVGVTGTRVTGVERGEGRAKVPYSVQSFGGHTYVIPDDAAPLLASGRLDRRLFDVTQLVADGYDDGHRRTLPLIVSYQGSAKTKDGAKQSLLSTDVEVERRLPAVNGESVTAEKSDTPSVWDALTRPTKDAVTTERGVDRVWLDARIEALPLQDKDPDPTQGTAQIHAPEAWKAGYDGKGVKVAVLDSGLDATHPDLKGAVAASKDFTGEDTTDDGAGHGTHVASSIVGSGARSGGKYKGVAPGAKLLVGRVLNDRGGGEESGLIAGMQWAAGQGAKVVSMSLGTTDTPGVDPVEKAVNDLSASSGALFVIAAGNEGPNPETVGTPGAASAALTVAAVDSEDRLADFSSRGPDTSGELKPDISAPTAGDKPVHLPLSVVRFTPKLSLTSTAKAGTELTVPVGIQGPAAKKGAVKSLTVEVSYDAGRTWKPATVHTGKDGERYLTLTHPAKPTTIGLKATLIDRDGNTVTETLPTAYRTVR